MPYRYAPVYLIAMLVLSALAFWPNYFSVIGSAPWTFHLHGLSSTVWMLLLMAQVLLIHNRQPRLHRLTGLTTLAVAPLFMAGGLLVIQTLLKSRADFALAYGTKIAAIDFVLMLAFAWLCYAALANRRNPALHGGYFLVTPLLLTESILTRIITGNQRLNAMLPGPDSETQFDWAMGVSQLLAIVLGLVAAAHYRRFPQPFYAIATLSAVAWAAYQFIGDTEPWIALMDAYRAMPQSLVAAIGLAIGIVAVVLGWKAGKPRVRSAATA